MESSLQLAPDLRAVRRRNFPWGWLALAAGLHALLLLVPVLRDLPAIPVRKVMNVALVTPPAAKQEDAVAEVVPELVPETAPVPESAPLEPLPEPGQMAAQQRSPDPSPDPSSDPSPVLDRETALPDPASSTASELLHDWRWQESPTPNSISRSVSSELYAEMSRPLLVLAETAFSESWLPDEVEIVDRWLEPGGVHNVVIRTPGGQTLCGRQQIVGPFRPWEQMPMMFRACGGGGKR